MVRLPAGSTDDTASSADQIGTAADTARATDLVVVAVDRNGRPELVPTAPGDAVSTRDDIEASSDLEVIAVEPDHPVSIDSSAPAQGPAALLSTDPYRPQQWALDMLDAEDAWLTSRGGSIDIAVVDTGVTGTHPDLASKLCSGVAFLGSTGIPGTGLGAVDGNGHGTHVAGIAAAAAGDGIGVAGVAPDARIIPVRVLDAHGGGSTSDVARGITWAVDHGAEVINLSLGGSYSVAIAAALDYAESRGVVVVAAAGNAGPTGPVNHPASQDTALAVASLDESGEVSWFSTRGEYVDVAAPGSGIMSTYNNGAWTYMSGTSMATPQVSGVAALLLAADPDLTPGEVRARIEGTANDMGPIGHDVSSGWGRVDPVAALHR